MADLATPNYLWPIPNPDDQLGDIAAAVGRTAAAIEDRFRRSFDTNSSTTSLDDTTMPSAAGTYEQSGTGKAQFVAPANISGRVHVYVSALLQINLTSAAGRELWLSGSIWEGPTSSPVADVDPANDFDAMMVGITGASGDMQAVKGSFWWVSATLTPGTTYHVQLYKKVNATSGHTIRIDQVTVRVFTR